MVGLGKEEEVVRACDSRHLHDRKARKVRRVMGCELRRQLSEPGAGACCDSILGTNIEEEKERSDN